MFRSPAALRHFASLRARLIFAFAAVIGVSLFLSSGGFLYMVREYQTQREKDRLESVALNTSGQVSVQLRRGVPLEEVTGQLEEIAGNAHARILLVDSRGMVLHDTEDNRLANRQFGLPGPALSASGREPGRESGRSDSFPSGAIRARVYQGVLDTPTGDQVYAFVPFAMPGLGYRVAVVAPEASLSAAWQELLPRLSLAALGSLAVSVALAWWLANSITRPVVAITRASEDMARGNYDQVHIAAAGGADEIGRLAVAFNGMAREVGRSHRAMRDLLANVSHDLRTPLTSIQGFAGALVDGTLSGGEGAREAGRVIGEESERMRRLVEDLLYLGRIESGQVTIERNPVDLGDLARAAELRFTFRAEQEGIHLVVEAGSSIHTLGDAHRLAQVLDNLLDNAFKHTPQGGRVTVVARVERSASPDPRKAARSTALLSVHNTGSVIPPADLDRVFERFYQVDKARTGNAGRGLGLAIAREIVQAHRGQIQARSDLLSGTTFTVTLPLVEAPREVRVDSSTAVGLEAVAAPTRGEVARRW